MSRFGRILAITLKEVRQLRRDKLTFAMIFGLPVGMVLLFGYAINQDVRHLSAGVVDHANTSLSRSLIQATEASQVVTIEYWVETPAEIEALLRKGRISVGIYVPQDFDRRVALGHRASAQLLVDAGDPIVLNAVRGLTELPVRVRQIPSSAFDRPPSTYELQAFFNPERRTEVQIVPGITGVILTMTMVLFAAVAIVRERERGNLEYLITTPVKPYELMVGKIIPYVVIGLFQVALVLGIGSLVFRVPVEGSLFDLYVGALFFIAASLAIGLVNSTIARSQFQTFQLTIIIMLPSILLSGFLFPYEGMPRLVQVLAEVIPLTHYVRIARAIQLRGASITDVTGEIVALGTIFAIAFLFAIFRFKKRLD